MRLWIDVLGAGLFPPREHCFAIPAVLLRGNWVLDVLALA